jgi:hypothetical protein
MTVAFVFSDNQPALTICANSDSRVRVLGLSVERSRSPTTRIDPGRVHCVDVEVKEGDLAAQPGDSYPSCFVKSITGPPVSSVTETDDKT